MRAAWLLVAITLAGCAGKKRGATADAGPPRPRGTVDCRNAMYHALEVYDLSSVPPEVKREVRAELEQSVLDCEAAGSPHAVLECTLAATTVEALQRCDLLKVVPEVTEDAGPD